MKTKSPSAAAFLKEAARIVRDRAGTHGCPLETHARITGLWNAYLAARPLRTAPLNAEDVALMMLLLKIARRLGGKGNVDDLLDIIGYAAIAAEVGAGAPGGDA